TCLSHVSLLLIPPSLCFYFHCSVAIRCLHSFPTRRSSDLLLQPSKGRFSQASWTVFSGAEVSGSTAACSGAACSTGSSTAVGSRSEEHTSELQSRFDLVCRLLLEKKKK